MAEAWESAPATEVNHRSAETSNDDANGVIEGATEAPVLLSKEEAFQKARDAGWTNPTAFNYDQFNEKEGSYDDYHGSAKVYEWLDEYGDVGPEVPELEKILFGGEFQMKKGQHLDNITKIEVALEGPQKIIPIKRFEDAGLHPVVINNLKKAGYDDPTPVQRYSIPALLTGNDLVGIAQTGSGKTAAYLVPAISKLMGKANKLAAPRPSVTQPGYNPQLHRVKAEPLIVVVVPTRELAMQIFDEARRMCYRSMLRPCVVYGGLPMKVTIEELGKGCDVLVATPGRLCDMMDKPNILSMNRLKFTIIDEADEMLHADWEEELKKIMGGGDSNEDVDHNYVMFSATFPKQLRKLAREYLTEDHFRVRVGRPGSAHKNIRQNIVEVAHDNKREAVYDLLFAMQPGRTIIFCNSRNSVDLLDDHLYNKGLPTTSIHSDRSQRDREDSFRNFKTGRCPILIATGVSARGWDIMDVMHVINYDLPSGMHGGITEYIHRIGRTARIGHQGLATSFYNERNEDIAEELVRCLVECECEIPDFLAQYAPEDKENLDFDDESEEDDEEGAAIGGPDSSGDGVAAGGWGGGDESGTPAVAGWGSNSKDAGDGDNPAPSGW